MDKEQKLNEALNILGIDKDYYDAMGGYHILSKENKEQILSLFGIKDLDKDIHKFECDIWKTPLEPVYAVTKNKSEFRIYFYEKVDFDYNNARPSIDGNELPIAWPGKSAEYKVIDDVIYHRHYFNIPTELDTGYHNLEIEIYGKKYSSMLIVAPETCYLPEFLKDGKAYGTAAHLYSVYSKGSQGIGDFSDLETVIEKTKQAGGDIVLTQPWHYVPTLQNDNTSPYYAFSRLFLNPIYIDLRKLGFKTDKNLNEGKYVDYNAVLNYKLPKLKEYFDKNKSDEEFLNFIKEDKLLEPFVIFCALYEKNNRVHWKDWDKKLQNPNSAEIKKFAKENEDELLFSKFLQYLTQKQLNEAENKALAVGMQIGLCNDLAVGAGHNNFEAWYYGEEIFIQKASVGAPPDPMEEKGQDWGLPPYNPYDLRKSQYAFYIELIRRNMKSFGALRLDHAMHIIRLFWVLKDKNNERFGTYVSMNINEMLAILAIESQRYNCMIIAEDLGTVPDGFRETLKSYNILITKEFYFEFDENGFFEDPSKYERMAISTVHTHDTATIKGYLKCHDLYLEKELGVIDEESYQKQKKFRERNFKELLHKYNLKSKVKLETLLDDLVLESNSCISLIYLDDLTKEEEQLNLPGTTIEHKNWCRKLSKPIEKINIKFTKQQ